MVRHISIKKGPAIQIGISLSNEDQVKITSMFEMMDISMAGLGWTETIRQVVKWGFAYCQTLYEQEQEEENKQEQRKEEYESRIKEQNVKNSSS